MSPRSIEAVKKSRRTRQDTLGIILGVGRVRISYLLERVVFDSNCVVPDYLTRVPIEQFRGFKTLNEKDKERVEKVIKSGTGSSWAALLEKNKPVKTEEQLEADKEKKAKKDKKKKEDDESMNMDMTEVLTGTQQKKTNNKKKVAEPTIEKVEKKKDALKPKTDKKNKVIKKKESAPVKAKEINLPKEDMDELANFDKLFAKLK